MELYIHASVSLYNFRKRVKNKKKIGQWWSKRGKKVNMYRGLEEGRPNKGRDGTAAWAVFIFLYFSFYVFYKNIFLFSKFIEIYSGRPAAGRPAPGHPTAGRQGLICKNFHKKLRSSP